MKAEQVCKLQENLAKEAIAYLMLYGTAVDVTPYRKAVTQVGMAWGLPIPGPVVGPDGRLLPPTEWTDLGGNKDLPVAGAGGRRAGDSAVGNAAR